MEPVDPPEKNIQDPANDVLTLTIYKLEPECLSYIFKMRSKYEPGQAEHLEQLVVMQDVVKKLKKQAEQGMLSHQLDISRQVRRDVREARLKEEASANDRPTGGEPKPN